MDRLSVHHGQHNGISDSKQPVHHHHGKGGGGVGGRKGKQKGGCGGGGGKGIKVVYISSPMKLTASAEEFRAVVQELTGRHSNVADHDAEGGAVLSYSHPSYFGRTSPASAPAAGARALPPAMAAADNYAAGAGAMAPPFQSMYDQTGGTDLLNDQDYYW